VFGERIYGPIGHLADVFAVFGTAFGVATSLGLGIQQIATGLGLVTGLQVSTTIQLGILAAVTLAATVSAVSGVRRGVRYLSNINLLLSVCVLAFFLILGPTRHLLGSLIQGTGDYVQHLIGLSTWLDVTGHSRWQESWTVFYWAWWIAWSPFVGMFIARISKGRTIREFVMGVLLVPAIFTFAWLAITGGTGLYIELFGEGGLVAALERDVSLPLFATIQTLSPGIGGDAMIVLIMALTAIYFVTSCDSGTLVITTILSQGDEEPPVAQRIAWGLGEGVIAGTLLSAGGLAALQSATIAAALPFSLIMLVMIFGLVKGLRDEPQAPREGVRTRGSCEPWTGCRRGEENGEDR
jgi:choline/glycine/proline betaine transport protein